jgi:excisionase family DNA binding protein
MENLYSIEEAANKLRISKWTLACWLSSGRIERTKCGGRTLIRESQLEKLLQDGGKSPSYRRRTPESTATNDRPIGARDDANE